MKPATPEAYDLFHQGSLALARAEHAGIRIDTKRLDKTIEKTKQQIKDSKEKLKGAEEFKAWRRRFGQNTNWTSRDQLAKVLVNDMGVDASVLGETAKDKKIKADVNSLEKVNTPFVKNYIKIQKLEKLLGTYLYGVRKHIAPDGFLRPSFGLHTTETFRSSSFDPNFQNIPIRDPDIAKLIRRNFISRPGYRLLENDFKGAEVCVAGCYHKDATMLQWLADGYDFHKMFGGECYRIPTEDVPKAIRQQAKALFVFAEFYGDWYPQVARSLWEAIDKHELVTKDGLPLKKHLKKKGIKGLGACDPDEKSKPGTLEHHIKKVEHDFWNKHFPQYKKWKEEWYADYLKEGYFNTLTGFLCRGIYSRNQAVNYPIQGSSFHCLLWCLIRLDRMLRKYKMKTVIIGQIHDSILSDVFEKELDDYLGMVVQVVEHDLPKAWPWIITRIQVEAELCPPGGSWYDKQEIQLAA